MHSFRRKLARVPHRFLKADPEGCQPREVCLFNCATVVAITTSTLASHVAGLTKRIRSRRRSPESAANSFSMAARNSSLVAATETKPENCSTSAVGIETTGRPVAKYSRSLRG